MRLNKYIATHSQYSRRSADSLIQTKQVLVNGKPAQLGQQITDRAEVIVKGKKLSHSTKLVYYLIHKPTGYISTTKDPDSRRVVTSLIPNSKHLHLYPVGRLDYDSEGLMLLTNDGDYTYQLTHPKFQIEKTYRVLVKGLPTTKQLAHLESGVIIDGRKTNPAKVELVEKQSGRTWIQITIYEGRNRQIRKMCHRIGHPVIRLIRLKLGPYQLGDLKPGEYKLTTKL